MNILILSQYYHPEPLPKIHELAESLAKKNHSVTVITGFPNYPKGAVFEGYKQTIFKRERINSVEVIRLPLFPDHSRSVLRRLLNYGSFALSVSILGPILIKKIDVMYVWHPPLTVGIPAILLGMVMRIPFLYAVHDLWPDSAVAIGMLKDNKFVSLLRMFEKFVYRRASIVGISSKGFMNPILQKNVPKEKIRLLTDWADGSVYRPLPKDICIAKEKGMDGKFNVVFGGQLGIAQGLLTLIEAAKLLKNYNNIQIVFVGDGVMKETLEKEKHKLGLDNVVFLGRLPIQDMSDIYAIADVLIVHLTSGFFSSLSIPGKTYSYMACGKPILMAADGVAADLITDHQAGETCEPENPQRLAETILKMESLDPHILKSMGQAGLTAFKENYSRRVSVDVHESILKEIAKQR